jgi:hypothetical protein
MRIILAVFFLLSANTLGILAQNLTRHDNKKMHFGISLGFNVANFSLTHSDAFIYHDSIKVVESPRSPGFNIGIISDLHLGKNADLRFIPSLVFAEKDLLYSEISPNGDVDVNKTLESIILNFPLSFKYKSDRFFNNFRFYAIGGLRFDWDLGSNAKARKATDIVKIKGSDFLVEYGVGLEFYFPLFIFSPEFRVSSGLPNLFVPTENLRYSDVLQSLKSRYFMITFQFEG